MTMIEYVLFAAIGAALILLFFYCGVKSAKQDGYNEGYDLGHEQGYHKGYTTGYHNGHADGREQGYKDGRQDGYEDGRRYEAVTEHNREQLEKMIAQHDYNITKD